MHPVAPSAGLNPHSAFGLGAGVERGSHVVGLAVVGPAAVKKNLKAVINNSETALSL